MNKLYTFGYTGSTPEDLKAYVQALDGFVIDIRYSPWSRVEDWRRYALRDLLAPAYTWVKALGNENYNNGGPIKLHDPERVVTNVWGMITFQPVILLCACHDYRKCHRLVAAEYLQKALKGLVKVEIEHLPTRFADWQHAEQSSFAG